MKSSFHKVLIFERNHQTKSPDVTNWKHSWDSISMRGALIVFILYMWVSEVTGQQGKECKLLLTIVLSLGKFLQCDVLRGDVLMSCWIEPFKKKKVILRPHFSNQPIA